MDPGRRLRRASLITTALASLTAAGAYTGAVSLRAFFAFLVPAVVIATIASFVGTRRQFGGLIAGLIAAGAWAVVVNALSGETSGPVARSAAICGLATVTSVYAARRMWAPALAAGVMLNMAGALYYGAAGEVRVLAVLAGLLTLVSVSCVDAARHRREVRRPRLAALVVGIVAAATLVLASVAVQQVAERLLERNRPVASSLVTPDAVRPPWDSSPKSTVTTTLPDPAQPAANSAEQQQRIVRLVVFLVLLLLLVIIVALLIRMAVGAWRLRRWKLRLRAQEPAASTGAAFGWMTYQLRRLGWRAPGNPGVDRLAAAAHTAGWPEPLLEPVRAVCTRSQRAVFEDAHCAPQTADDTWGEAERAVETGRAHASRWRRLGAVAGLLRT